jgi:hypothetical protein
MKKKPVKKLAFKTAVDPVKKKYIVYHENDNAIFYNEDDVFFDTLEEASDTIKIFNSKENTVIKVFEVTETYLAKTTKSVDLTKIKS